MAAGLSMPEKIVGHPPLKQDLFLRKSDEMVSAYSLPGLHGLPMEKPTPPFSRAGITEMIYSAL